MVTDAPPAAVVATLARRVEEWRVTRWTNPKLAYALMLELLAALKWPWLAATIAESPSPVREAKLWALVSKWRAKQHDLARRADAQLNHRAPLAHALRLGERSEQIAECADELEAALRAR